MNLYNFHSKPESLLQYTTMSETNPHIFWEKYKNSPEELKKREKYIVRDPEYAYLYALDVLKFGQFPAGEAAIAKDAKYAYLYAKDILASPFPAGEAIIAKNAYYASHYARGVLKKPFPAGEAAIAQDARYAYAYAHSVLKGAIPCRRRSNL